MSYSKNSDFATSIEPAFYFGLNKESQVPDALSAEKVANYFEYSLKKNPKDLSRHIQRVEYALTRNSESSLFAALCDLFIILGRLGEPLRKRLLRLSKKKLQKSHLQILIHQLKNTQIDLSSEVSILPENCLFRKESIELLNTCKRTETQPETQSSDDILHTADSYIENSQFDTALDYMTDHLMQDMDNEELTIKLISLFKALTYKDKFHEAYDQFANNLLTSRYWDEAKQYFLTK